MCTKTARPSCAIVSCWCPLTGEKRSFRNNPGQPNLSNLTFLPPPNRRLPPQSRKPLRPRPPDFPAPSSTPQSLGRRLYRSRWGQRGRQGIRGPRKCACDLGLKKVAPSSPTHGRRGFRRPDRPSRVPEMMSLRQGRLAGAPRTEARARPPQPRPLPSASRKKKKKKRGKGSAETKGEVLRSGPAESPRKGGPASGGPGQKRGERASPEGAGWALGAQFHPGTRWRFWRPGPRRVPLAARALGAGRWDANPVGNVQGESKGRVPPRGFAPGLAPREENVAAIGPQR